MKRRIKLTKMERELEAAAERGEFVSVSRKRFEEIAEAIAARRKDAVLNIRVNSGDLENLKEKAGKLGVKYQTFISELLHRAAQA